MTPLPPTCQTSYRAPVLASLMLVLTLLQGSSFNLSLAFRGPLASAQLVSLVTVLWLAMYLFATARLFVTYGVNWISWLVRYRLLLTCLLAGTAFSVAWSVDTALSIERTVHLVGTTLIALYLGFSLPLNQLLRISATVLGFIMAASTFAAIFVPELGLENYQGEQVWTGALASKNTLGFWAAIAFLLCINLCFWVLPTRQRLLYLAMAAISLLCLYNSVSATSLLSLATAILITLYLFFARHLRLSMTAVVLLGLLVSGICAVAFYYIDTAELIGRSGDLTGRGEVWAQTWQLILDRPLTGYGYGALWYPTTESMKIQQALTDFSWTVFHAHNGLLHIASEIGVPLTMLAVLMIVQQLVEIVYCQYQRQQPGVLFILGFVVALMVSNYSEARLLVNRDLYWIFFIALPVSMLRQLSMDATYSEFGTQPPYSAAGTPHRLRESRERKEKKQSIKERARQRASGRVVNPGSTGKSSSTDEAALSNSASPSDIKAISKRRHNRAI